MNGDQPRLIACRPQELDLRVHELSTVHRQRDAHFVEILHALRKGVQTAAQFAELQ